MSLINSSARSKNAKAPTSLARKLLRILAGLLLALLLLLLVGPFLVPVPNLEGLVSARSLADADSRFIDVNGLEVHYKQAGQGEPYIILLHGFGASQFSWREVMAPLAEVGTVIAYDRPAFGLTERPMAGEWQGESPYSTQSQVNLLFGLMDQLGFQKAILVGNSAGGTIATLATLQQPQRVQALVMVDAAIYNGGGSPAWVRPLLHTPQLNRLGPLAARQLSERGEEGIRQAWHDPSKVTPEIYAGYRKPLQVENWDKALWELTRSSRESGLALRLGELNLPVLVVTGDDDRIVPTENSLQLAKDVPGSQLVVFTNCGHLPQEECPQAFLAAVIPFIQATGE
jgi:pimeloyl-ACP methyl ester carboxylesterase